MMTAESADPNAKRGAERGAECSARLEDGASNLSYGGSLCGSSFRPHHVCAARATPNLHISGRVPHIFKAGLGKMLRQELSFARAFEIHVAVAGVDLVKQIEVSSNRLSQFAIGCRDQGDAAPGSFFLLEKIENLLPIRKAGGVDVDARSESAFKCGSPGKQPKRKQQKRERAGFEEHKDALPKHVASDQGAIEIDAQDWAHRLGSFDSGERPHEIIVA